MAKAVTRFANWAAKYGWSKPEVADSLAGEVGHHTRAYIRVRPGHVPTNSGEGGWRGWFAERDVD
eukprot:7814854-Pyramimonas_sp.AAC.1